MADIKLTSLCYIQREGAYLMLYRNKKKEDPNGGKWIGVGGHFENCESPDECLCREVAEETGLKLTSWQPRGLITFCFDGWGCEYMHLFTADRFEGCLTDCDEGELAWIPESELITLPMWEGDRIFLRLIAEGAPYFNLKLCYNKEGALTDAILDGEVLSV